MKSESDTAALDKRVLDAEVKMTDAKSEALKAKEAERVLRRRLENLQGQLKQKEADSELREQNLQVSKYLVFLRQYFSFESAS